MIMSLFYTGCLVAGYGLGMIGEEIHDSIEKRKKEANRKRIQNYLEKEVEKIKLLSTEKERLEERFRLERYLFNELVYTHDAVFIIEMRMILDDAFHPVEKRN